LIEEALTRSDTLDFLRANDVTADKLLEAANYRKRRERRRRIGHPKMNLAERQAVLNRQQSQIRPPKLSRWLECLAAEVKSGRSGKCYAMQRDPQTGGILARARKATWNMSRQKVIVLDGTANVDELRIGIPSIKETQIDVPRNAIIIQIYSGTYSKRSTLHKTMPTSLLRDTVAFMELCAQIIPRDTTGRLCAAAFTTKAIRAALTHKVQFDKLAVAEEFGPALLGHYGNVKGANDFEHCAVGFLIGRNEWPWSIIEDAAKAWNFDSRRELQFIAADPQGKKSLIRRSAVYHVKPKVTVPKEATLQKVSCHPDPTIQRRFEAPRENEEFQTIDRLRLIHNLDPKLVFIFSNIPLPIPVDMLVSDTEIDDARRLFQLIAEAGKLGWQDTIPLLPVWLHATFPGVFRTVKLAEN
jgi:hypothetical protein